MKKKESTKSMDNRLLAVIDQVLSIKKVKDSKSSYMFPIYSIIYLDQFLMILLKQTMIIYFCLITSDDSLFYSTSNKFND